MYHSNKLVLQKLQPGWLRDKYLIQVQQVKLFYNAIVDLINSYLRQIDLMEEFKSFKSINPYILL